MEKAKPPEGDTSVGTERIELRDRHGRVRMVLGDIGDPERYVPGLVLLDAHGRQRSWWALFPYGPSLTFETGGNERLVLGVDDGDSPGGDDDLGYDPTAYVVACDGTGLDRAAVRVHNDGAVELKN